MRTAMFLYLTTVAKTTHIWVDEFYELNEYKINDFF